MAELNQAAANAGGKTSKKLSTRVDLTAMVDLAFLLVTFFMLTTTLAKPMIMSLVMPDPGPVGNVAASRTMTVCLGKGNQLIYYRGTIDKPMDGGPVVAGFNKEGLRRAIFNIAKKVKDETGKPMIVLIKPSAHSVYDNLVNTIDELNIAKMNIYAVADISPKDIDLLKQKSIF